MKSNWNLIIVGGGASGMVAAIRAAERKRDVLMIEKADHPGRKVAASGNGRCNMMNSGELRYYGDADFAKCVIGLYPQDRLAAFFRKYGLLVSEDQEGRIYPITFQSASVLSVLKNAMEQAGVQTVMNTRVISVIPNKDGFTVSTSAGHTYESRKVIIACGGASQPQLGGTEDGYKFLQSMGHRIINTFPALVPLVTDSKSISGLSGIRVRGRVSLFNGCHQIHTEEGEILFTEYGISGICVMQCARFVHGANNHLDIDFFKGIFESNDVAESEMKRRQGLFHENSPVILLEGILPHKISYAVMKQAGIPLRGEKAGDLSDDQIRRIIHVAKQYRIEIKETRGLKYSQVTAGGADCREFNPITMESRKIHGLYATGEVLNVDGDCGGYNLMFAFASGLIAGEAV